MQRTIWDDLQDEEIKKKEKDVGAPLAGIKYQGMVDNPAIAARENKVPTVAGTLTNIYTNKAIGEGLNQTEKKIGEGWKWAKTQINEGDTTKPMGNTTEVATTTPVSTPSVETSTIEPTSAVEVGGPLAPSSMDVSTITDGVVATDAAAQNLADAAIAENATTAGMTQSTTAAPLSAESAAASAEGGMDLTGSGAVGVIEGVRTGDAGRGAGAAAGSYAGGAMGSVFGPVGTFVGSAIGSYLGAELGDYLT